MDKKDMDFSGSWASECVEGGRQAPTIYLFRHAQTFFNRKHYFTGWKDSKLTPFGRKQARIIAQKLKGKKIDIAFSTSLSRSRETLRAVLRYHPECKRVFIDDRMAERSYGELQGRSHDAYKRTHTPEELHQIRRSYDHPPPRGESIKMVEGRVLPFLRDLLSYMRKHRVNVAISAHGNSMRPFRRYFEKLSIKQMMSLENPWDDYFEYRVR
jgi:2,3-bisphosphoglycerate-dependent phosphoglycerate mutase